MNILLTGGNGYIASSIYNSLKDSYSITRITRQDLDLLDSVAVNGWFSNKRFDVVIHTAITGGSRLKHDDVSIIDNNLRMYYNLLDNQNKFDRFISIGSGAELYYTDTPYGLSKHVIRQSMLEKSNFYNIRVFAVFDENELDTRFIKSNIKRYISKKPIVIHKNKHMDFFYMNDFVKIVEYYLTTTDPVKEIDCTYETSQSLQSIAEIINTLSDYTVPIEINTTGMDIGYTGTHTSINIQYDGITTAIKSVYNKLLCKI